MLLPAVREQTIWRLSSENICLHSLYFALYQAVRNGKPVSFLQSKATLPQETSQCQLELQILDLSLVLTDFSLEMIPPRQTLLATFERQSLGIV